MDLRRLPGRNTWVEREAVEAVELVERLGEEWDVIIHTLGGRSYSAGPFNSFVEAERWAQDLVAPIGSRTVPAQPRPEEREGNVPTDAGAPDVPLAPAEAEAVVRAAAALMGA